jgi:hypothetical protein
MDKKIKMITVPQCTDFARDCKDAEYIDVYGAKVCNHLGHVFTCKKFEKRKPINGVLPLTEEELKEFQNLFLHDGINLKSVMYQCGEIVIKFTGQELPDLVQGTYTNHVKAILWLANLFDLTGVNND